MFRHKWFSLLIDGLVTTGWFYLFSIVPIIVLFFSIFFMVYSPYRWVLLPYLVWIWIDRKAAMRGNRGYKKLRECKLVKCIINYFQVQFIKENGWELDPERNYLFCFFPHGVIPFGMVCMMVNCEETRQILPYHTPFLCIMETQFYIPFTREYFILLGGISASEESIRYNLTKPNGGNIVSLAVGGAAEACYCKPNSYKLAIKKKKGFVRIALETGTPLVPVITFNETSIFDQFSSPTVITIQQYLRRLFIYPFLLFKGSYLFCPKHVPLSILVGQPIEVAKKPSPSRADIDVLHQLFITKLTELFEKNKHKYIVNAENIFLEIV